MPQPSAGSDEPAGTGNPTTTGDGTLYQVLDPLLYQYNEYFNSTAPFEQLTEQAIANLLAEQSAWSATTGVSGSIEGNVVTVNNATGSSIEVPLTGTNIGTKYAGTQSGWTDAPSGTSTYTALAAWPAEPVTPPVVTGPGGGTPGNGSHPPIVTSPPPHSTPPPPPTKKAVAPAPFYYEVVQAAPTTVKPKNGKVTVSLNCVGKNGKAAKGHICTGKFTLTVMGQNVSQTFKVKVGKVDRVTVKLPKKARIAAAGNHHRKMKATLVISTKQPRGSAKVTRGTLTIKT